MIKEWLLIAWVGTSTNFVLLGQYWDVMACSQARDALVKSLPADVTVVCTQDMREGRSRLPDRPGSSGIAK